jgi:hypothetical protein
MLPLERKKLSKTDATVFFIHFLNPFVGISSLTVVRMHGVA